MSNDLVPTGPRSPAAIIPPAPKEQLALLSKAIDCCDGNVSPLRKAYALVANADFTELKRWLKHARRPATPLEVAKSIGILVACFPGNSSDVLVPTICSDVLDENPTAFALEEACRTIRKTSKWPRIMIAEIIEAIADAEDNLRNILARLNRVTTYLPRIKDHIEYLDQRREQDIQHAVSIMQKWGIDCVNNGISLGCTEDGVFVHYSADIVEEAKRRMAPEAP
jgi:hypothetical protein